MIKKILSKPFGFINSFLVRRSARKVYLAHLEADYCRLKMEKEMRRLHPETWA